ncbi:MAG TPA: iron-containing alcohol dehydrogenase [Solirubrobacteraceae bacterium]|nr:iron-containing alcohol dehydrogenase [Solirubrobacteraceae bacterium]
MTPDRSLHALALDLEPFDWRDGERQVRFGRGRAAEPADLLGDGYTLLTTARARAAAPAIAEAAGVVELVAPGRVDELAAALRPAVGAAGAPLLVALGGGRVIDTAKALAAADPPLRVAAIPTTLSGAEMTTVHRHAQGVPITTPRVRPAIVLNDPALCASQPEQELVASALNALGHAAEGPLTVIANPVATLAALAGARLMAGALADAEPERDALALGALLSGYAIDSAGYGLHHVMSQTLARLTPAGHAPANAIMLPHTLRALERRFPERMARLAAALGDDPPSLAARLARRTGAARLRERGVTPEMLAECADAAAERPELALTPPPADRAELLALYESAY